MFDAMPASTCDELPKGFSTTAHASLVPLGSRTPRTSAPQLKIGALVIVILSPLVMIALGHGAAKVQMFLT